MALTAWPLERVIVFVPAARPEPPSVAGVVVIGTESAFTVAGKEITPPLGAVLSSVSVNVVSLWFDAITYVASAVLVFGLPIPKPTRDGSKRLDFVVLSDHNTVSQDGLIAAKQKQLRDLLLIRGCEEKGRGLPDGDQEALPLDDAVELALSCLNQATGVSPSTSSPVRSWAVSAGRNWAVSTCCATVAASASAPARDSS